MDVWLSMSDGRVIPGRFTENLDEPVASQAFMWFDVERNLLDPEEVQYWRLREPGDPIPEPPR